MKYFTTHDTRVEAKQANNLMQIAMKCLQKYHEMLVTQLGSVQAIWPANASKAFGFGGIVTSQSFGHETIESTPAAHGSVSCARK